MIPAALKHPLASASAVLAHPLETWVRFYETYIFNIEQRGPRCEYQIDERWEERLHHVLGAPWPCPATKEFWTLWQEVVKVLQAKGISVGPSGFKSWNDGDPGLVRAIWCLVRHLRPHKVIETGVGHGVTSRFVLEALEMNGAGHLWSIDLPPVDPFWQKQIGLAVGDRDFGRWSYIRGPSRLKLPKLLSFTGEIELFIHDSMHSERNVRFELDRVWRMLKPGGALVVDDVDVNGGFRSFLQATSGHCAMVCESEPLHPDTRRFNKKGLFGIIIKTSAELPT